MDINEISDRKQKLETEIMQLITAFQNETGVMVSDIDYSALEATTYQDSVKKTVPYVQTVLLVQ